MLAAFFLAATAPVGQSLGAQPSDEPTRPSRVVCRFDFDERAAGNLDEVPMYWDALRPDGFPSFAAGHFDESQGNTAPPSFYLASAGRNVAYAYSGPDTRVRVGGSYRVEAFIRPDRLKHGRACLSAYFLDRKGLALLETTVRSPDISGPADSPWSRVEVHLPPAPPQAHSIGVAVWVLRQDVLHAVEPAAHRIPRTDVHGGAWFDDITIYRLPVAELRSSVPGNVLAADDPRHLEVSLMDPDGGSLAARVSVANAEGRVVQNETFSVDATDALSVRTVDVKNLPPGFYHATLEVRGQGILAAARDMDLMSLAHSARPTAAAQSFGVVLDDPAGANWETQLGLIERLGVRAVKLPLWGDSGDPLAGPDDAAWEEAFFRDLQRRNLLVTAMLAATPLSAGRTAGFPITAWLSDDPAVWGETLAAVAAPNAGLFRWWQIGSDRQGGAESIDEMSAAAKNLRGGLRQFITEPRLAASSRLPDATCDRRLPVEQLVLTIGAELDRDWLTDLVGRLHGCGYSQISGYVPPLPEERYDRQARLAEFAQRIISARYAALDTVWTPQLWRQRRLVDGEFVEPLEEFVLLRSIVEVLGDATPGQRVFVADGVTCLTFHASGRTVLGLWDSLAPPDGRVHPLPMGRGDRALSLWGQSTALEQDLMGRSVVRLSPMPVFVEGIDRGMVDFVTSLTLTPSHVTAGQEIVRHALEFRGPDDVGLSGEGVLEGPSSLEITPRTFSLHVSPGQTQRVEFTVRYPHTEPAGRKVITAKLRIGPSSQYVEVPLFVELGVADLDVWGSAVVEGGDLILRQVVSNRASSVLSFRGSARVPGRERQYRPLANLGPAESQTVEYRFPDGASLIGRSVRLMLQELNDGPRVHTLELVVP